MLSVEYYDLETNRTYFIHENLVFYFQHEGKFEHLCFHFWRENPIWIKHFGRTPKDICWQWKILNIKPCPQAPSNWMSQHINFNKQHWILDIERSLFVLRTKLHDFIDSKFNNIYDKRRVG